MPNHFINVALYFFQVQHLLYLICQMLCLEMGIIILSALIKTKINECTQRILIAATSCYIENETFLICCIHLLIFLIERLHVIRSRGTINNILSQFFLNIINPRYCICLTYIFTTHDKQTVFQHLKLKMISHLVEIRILYNILFYY